ncbi:DEKNAAC100253 [Brettanomyces naardenensis]|uniref:Glutathione hydrolase n=1 Tax=Brettanomyces naardenensis TaxID=13370 RepID=A0A448YGN1_BRENA|nr:DEKNAAC100253 [Brettanomyces naardenensis]
MPDKTPEHEPLLARPKRHAVTRRAKIFIVVATLITGILFSVIITITHSTAVPYPRPPKVPAHVPFLAGPTWHPRKNNTVVASYGAVASDREVCSQLGVDILKRGGYAADAAVATCLCIGAVDTMISSGIGGGAFITSKQVGVSGAVSIDAREMAPGAAHRDMFEGREIASKFGGLAVAIPGELRGLYTLYKMHGSGTISWSDLVTPVAAIAREGWEVSEYLAFALRAEEEALRFYREDWDFVFNSDGSLKKEGDWISRPAYADTLDLIARNGSDKIFYDPHGPIAPYLAGKAHQWGGILTKEDFVRYQAVVEPAIELRGFSDRNLTVYAPAGASSGLALVSGLQIIDGFEETEGEDFAAVPTQRLVESMKWMASVRTHLGDVGVYNHNETALAEHVARYRKFIAPEWTDRAREKISDKHTLPWPDYEPAYQANEPHGTSSLSVVDYQGNAVTITTTVNLLLGSVVHDPKTGVILNDEMDDFSIPTTKNAFDLVPSVYNYIAPYKRPLSSSGQSIIYDPQADRVDLVIGAAGGSRIPTALFQAIVRIYHYNMDILDAIAFPRLHHQLIPEVLYIEKPLRSEMVKEMEERGHTVEGVGHKTAMNGIRVKGGKIYAQSDHWRKLGRAVGY